MINKSTLLTTLWSLTLSCLVLYACDGDGGAPSGSVYNSPCSLEGEAICNDKCVDTRSDPEHCGACGEACPSGFLCVNGDCERGGCGAQEGERICDGACVDLNTDGQHCGACNVTCAEGARCEGGDCLCATGLTECIDSCVNLEVDRAHCGACFNDCASGQDCIEGECRTSRDEFCDGEDNDLDGLIDEDKSGGPLTIDCSTLCGSGTRVCVEGAFTECDAPQGTEEVCDSSDNDCDGLADEGLVTTYYEDRDGDGYGSADLTVALSSCAPPTISGPNGGTYVTSNIDCNDDHREVYPTAPELCDLIDNNCDGTVDEGCSCLQGETRPCGLDVGVCRQGLQTCVGETFGACEGDAYIAPSPERCDGRDEDCDGVTDEGLTPDLYELAEGAQEGDTLTEGANDRCEGARQLMQSVSGAPSVAVQNASLYTSAGVDAQSSRDIDWYRIKSTDSVNFCTPSRPQCLTMLVEFEHPSSLAENDLQVCLTQLSALEDACAPVEEATPFCLGGGASSELATYDALRRTHSMLLEWPGICGLDDSRYFAVEVSSPLGVNSCEPYSLRFRTELSNSACPE